MPPTPPHKNEDKYSFFPVLSCLNKTEPPSRPSPPLSPFACRCTHPLCASLHASPLRVVARIPSARRCMPSLLRALAPPPLRALARPCTRRRIVRARVWGEGEGTCSRNRAVLQVHRDTFAVLRCAHNVARCTRTLNHKGTVFSGTGRGMTHGTRGLPVSCHCSQCR